MKRAIIIAVAVALTGLLIAGAYHASRPVAEQIPAAPRRVTAMPMDLDLRTEKRSYASKFKVAVTSRLDPIAINAIHAWELRLTDPHGKPVDGAEISITGGMPMHGHGLPTAPRVTQNLGGGRYLVEGIKFNMSGWWELSLQIEGGAGHDRVTFSLILK